MGIEAWFLVWCPSSFLRWRSTSGPSGCGFDRLTLHVRGIWYAAWVDGTFRSMVFRQWRIYKCPVYTFPGFCLLLCTQFMVDVLIQLSWILLRLFSTSHISTYTPCSMAWCSTLSVWRCPHDTFHTLLHWLNEDFGQISHNDTSTLIIYCILPKGEFAFVIGP